MLHEIWVDNKTGKDVWMYSHHPGLYPRNWITIPAYGGAWIWVCASLVT